ncbi:hypothetical protein [Exiguobacterium sp. s142]|uniref:hypothetical protein n=1 Tax=Exiguobacterium sp. s142 TaxID=2751222 RepID=UPI001BECE5A8|nr:hypothetical protein [Exiguobacterium sp. s142]
MMIQIFGDDLCAAFEENKIPAELKYKTIRELDRYEHGYEVWELTDENLRKLDAISDDVWSERNYGWYRYGERSQYPDGAVHIVNGHEMIGYSLDEDRLEIFQGDEKGHAIFKHVLDYIYSGEGLSTEKNIAITCITLSMANSMTLAEFMTKYY